MASSHASSGISVMTELMLAPYCFTGGDRKPLSHPSTRGPASTTPSRAKASAMIEARGPCPIGLRETTSTPMARAAHIAVKGSARWTSSRVAHSFSVGTSSSEWPSNRSRSSVMKTTRPAGASPRAAPRGVGALSASKGACRLRRSESGSSKEDGPLLGGRSGASPAARRIHSRGVCADSVRSWSAIPSTSICETPATGMTSRFRSALCVSHTPANAAETASYSAGSPLSSRNAGGNSFAQR